MSSSLYCLSKNSFFTTSAKACCKNEPKIETMGLSWAPKLNHVVSIILLRLMNLMILSCGLPLQWDLKLAEVFLTSVYFACDKIHWPDICDVINDSEAWGSYLKNHERFSIVSERVIWVARWLKTKRCYYCKGIHNSAIFNKREEKEAMETTWNLHSSSQEMILRQTAKVYVIDERNSKEIK